MESMLFPEADVHVQARDRGRKITVRKMASFISASFFFATLVALRPDNVSCRPPERAMCP